MIALDTNVIVYAFDRDEGARCERAQQILTASADVPLRIPLQAVGETFAVLTRKRGWSRKDARGALEALLPHAPVQPASLEDARRAMALSEKHDLPYWDALIVVVAASAGCDMLLSEDLQDGRIFGKDDVGRTIRVVNPFDAANDSLIERAGLLQND